MPPDSFRIVEESATVPDIWRLEEGPKGPCFLRKAENPVGVATLRRAPNRLGCGACVGFSDRFSRSLERPRFAMVVMVPPVHLLDQDADQRAALSFFNRPECLAGNGYLQFVRRC